MCTYQTEVVELRGSAKGPDGWFKAEAASVYFDHPVHHPRGHALMVDVLAPQLGPSARVALELDPQAARALATAILKMVDEAPADLLNE